LEVKRRKAAGRVFPPPIFFSRARALTNCFSWFLLDIRTSSYDGNVLLFSPFLPPFFSLDAFCFLERFAVDAFFRPLLVSAFFFPIPFVSAMVMRGGLLFFCLR